MDTSPIFPVIRGKTKPKALGKILCSALFALSVMWVASILLSASGEKIARLNYSADRAFLAGFISKYSGVLCSVNPLGYAKFQILNVVIESVPVSVMNYFSFEKRSSNVDGHNVAMFKNPHRINRNNFVSGWSNGATLENPMQFSPDINTPTPVRAKSLLSILGWPPAGNVFNGALFTYLRFHGANVIRAISKYSKKGGIYVAF